MKKLLIGICVISIIASCGPKKSGTSSAAQLAQDSARKALNAVRSSVLSTKQSLSGLNLFTLNGIPLGRADAMVNSFLTYKGSYYSSIPTCVFFSQTAFQKMNSIIANPLYDGFRVYFARTVPDGEYTIVILPTEDGGEDPTDPSTTDKRHIHNDSYLHSDPSMPNVDLNGELGSVTPTEGALLYGSTSPCPPGADHCPPGPHYIPCSKAYKMATNFSVDEINATAEWYDKGIIDQLSKKISTNGGVRVYFARQLNPIPPDNIARHCFLFVLTQKSNNIQLDDYACFVLTPNAQYIKNQIGIRGDGGGTDNGEECPNSCEGVTWP